MEKNVFYFNEELARIDLELQAAIKKIVAEKIKQRQIDSRRFEINFKVDNASIRRTYTGIGLNWNDEVVLIYKGKWDDGKEYIAVIFSVSLKEKLALYKHLNDL